MTGRSVLIQHLFRSRIGSPNDMKKSMAAQTHNNHLRHNLGVHFNTCHFGILSRSCSLIVGDQVNRDPTGWKYLSRSDPQTMYRVYEFTGN